MLSSIILSLAVNTSPAPAVDQDALNIEQTGRSIRDIRIGKDRKKIKINDFYNSKENAELAAKQRKTIRL